MAVTVDCAADTAPAFTTTVAVWVTPIPSIVAEIVFDSAWVDDNVPVATPLAFVVAAGCVSVLPPPVADRITVAPATGLSSASRAVTVIVEALAPFEAVIGDVAAMLECPPETVLAVTTTVAVCVIATVLMVADTVLDSATSELSVPVTTPPASVVPSGCVSVFPAVGVAASVTVAPSIGFPPASRAVTVMVDWLDPLDAVIGEVAVTVDCAADTAPAFTTTVAVCVIATALIVAEIVFDSASVDASAPVATPLAFVGAAGCVSVFPDPVAASTTVAAGIGFSFAWRAVAAIV